MAGAGAGAEPPQAGGRHAEALAPTGALGYACAPMNRPERQLTHLKEKIDAKSGRAPTKPGKRLKRWKKAVAKYETVVASFAAQP